MPRWILALCVSASLAACGRDGFVLDARFVMDDGRDLAFTVDSPDAMCTVACDVVSTVSAPGPRRVLSVLPGFHRVTVDPDDGPETASFLVRTDACAVERFDDGRRRGVLRCDASAEISFVNGWGEHEVIATGEGHVDALWSCTEESGDELGCRR